LRRPSVCPSVRPSDHPPAAVSRPLSTRREGGCAGCFPVRTFPKEAPIHEFYDVGKKATAEIWDPRHTMMMPGLPGEGWRVPMAKAGRCCFHTSDANEGTEPRHLALPARQILGCRGRSPFFFSSSCSLSCLPSRKGTWSIHVVTSSFPHAFHSVTVLGRAWRCRTHSGPGGPLGRLGAVKPQRPPRSRCRLILSHKTIVWDDIPFLVLFCLSRPKRRIRQVGSATEG